MRARSLLVLVLLLLRNAPGTLLALGLSPVGLQILLPLLGAARRRQERCIALLLLWLLWRGGGHPGLRLATHATRGRGSAHQVLE